MHDSRRMCSVLWKNKQLENFRKGLAQALTHGGRGEMKLVWMC